MAGKRRATPRIPGEQPEAAPAAKSEEGAQPAAGDELPDQSEIDPKTIRRPVLSKQGWVLPVEKPGPTFAKG